MKGSMHAIGAARRLASTTVRSAAKAGAALGIVAMIAVACTERSSAGGGGRASACGDFCSKLQGGDNCGELDVGTCKDECKDLSATCADLAPDVLDCLDGLTFTCVATGFAVAVGDTDPGAVTTLSTPSSTLEIHDERCGNVVIAFQTCTPTGGAGGGSSSTSGSGGGATSSTSSTSGSGGDNGCPPDHPVSCDGTSCWTADVDCSSIEDCDGDLVACSNDESAADMVVDCAYHDCVATPGSCSGNAGHPVYCPARHGTKPACWSPGTACSTVVACAGGVSLSCSQADHAVDCAANECLAPLEAESNDAACSDGVDDDGNGYHDCADFHCLANPTITVCAGENDEGACSDGVDNDGNGYTDCADYSCQASPSVTSCSVEHTDAACHDSVDNDADGKKDCADTSCFASAFVSCP